MPRSARLDIPGLLQHVIVRGVDRCDIFRDDADRRRFLQSFAKLLVETDTECLAWSLMTNHFHLLLRPFKPILNRKKGPDLFWHIMNENKFANNGVNFFMIHSNGCSREKSLCSVLNFTVPPVSWGFCPSPAGELS